MKPIGQLGVVLMLLLSACSNSQISNSTNDSQKDIALFPVCKGEGIHNNYLDVQMDQTCKWGYIDTSGTLVIDYQFDMAFPFFEGLACVKVDNGTEGKWGYIDENGTFVIPPRFDQADKFSEGLARVEVEKRIGFIDKKGEMVVQPIWKNAFYMYSEGLVPVMNEDFEGNFGYIDNKGRMVIPPVFTDVDLFSEGLAAVAVGESNNCTYGYINKNGEFAITPQFQSAVQFSEGLAAVKKDGVYGFIDKTGQMMFTLPSRYYDDYWEAYPRWKMRSWLFKDGIVCINVQGSSFVNDVYDIYVDRNGKIIDTWSYLFTHPREAGRLYMEFQDGKMIYENSKWEIVWQER